MRSFATSVRAWAVAALLISGGGPHMAPEKAFGHPLSDKEPSALAAARALAEKGAYEEAVARLEARLSAPGIGRSEKARIFHTLSYLHLFSNRPEEALRSTGAAVDWALEQSLPAEAALFRAETAIQKAYARALGLRSAGDIPGSTAAFAEADALAGRIGSLPFRLKIAGTWSVNYLRAKDGQAGYLDLCLRALELAELLGYRGEAAAAAAKVGAYHALRNDRSRALSYHLRALNYLAGTRDDKGLIVGLNNVAVMYSLLGDHVRAKDYLLEASSRVPAGSMGALGTSLLINLGSLFGDLGQRLRSDELRQRALECFSSALGPGNARDRGLLRLGALAGTAEVYVDQGRFDEAREILVPALTEAGRTEGASPEAGRILTLLGETSLGTGATPEAETYFEEALSVSSRTGHPLLAMRAAYGLGRCAERRGDIGQAIELYELALSSVGAGFSGIISDIHRAEFIGRSREPFQALANLYLELSKRGEGAVDDLEREIFRLVESLKARSYLEFQQRLRSGRGRPEPDPQGPEEMKLRRERNELLKSLARKDLGGEERDGMKARLLRIDDLLDAAVFDRYDVGADRARSLRPVPLDQLQNRVLDDRTVILEYILGETASILLCIGPDSLDLVELPPARELEDALTGYLSFLEDPSLPAEKGWPAARRLYRTLVAPAEPFIHSRVDRLIIVPDGELFRLPFEALALPGAADAAPALVNDRFTVSYAPSASSLALAGARRDELRYAKDALAFGASKIERPAQLGRASPRITPSRVLDDIYGRRGFRPGSLPQVEAEIADLGRRSDPGRIDVFQGYEATESALKGLDLRAYRLIHLACHAFSDDNDPLRSALLLAPEADDREDGYLQVSEIYDLRTEADLVVLSACRTGRGRLVLNEGNLGLPRVFFYMGARSVLSTLWPVNDRSGAAFMKHFYDAYFRGEGKAAALRSAKRAMGKGRYAHPYFWAPYVLTGDPDG